MDLIKTEIKVNRSKVKIKSTENVCLGQAKTK